MSSESAVVVRGLTKRYPLLRRPLDRLRQVIGLAIPESETFTALQDINLEIKRGSTVGIIGHNGSGKSTLLQTLCGTLQPSSGSLEVNGRISALLELGAGFNPEFTGQDNVYMQGAIQGFSADEVRLRLPQIEAFADIGEFFHRPVKTYSSGMFVRLAFAAAIHADPDILIVDEALAVGDIAFQHKCMARMREFMQRGTLILVSHDLTAITALCTEVIWLDHGRIRQVGDPKTVVERYWEAMYAGINEKAVDPGRLAKKRDALLYENFPDVDNLVGGRHESFGTREAEIIGIQVLDAEGNNVHEIRGGDILTIQVSAKAHTNIAHPIIGITLKDLRGNEVTGTNTDFELAGLAPLPAGKACSVRFRFRLPEIAPGSYSLSPAIANGSESRHSMLHWVNNPIVLQVNQQRPVMGRIRLDIETSTNHA